MLDARVDLLDAAAEAVDAGGDALELAVLRLRGLAHVLGAVGEDADEVVDLVEAPVDVVVVGADGLERLPLVGVAALEAVGDVALGGGRVVEARPTDGLGGGRGDRAGREGPRRRGPPGDPDVVLPRDRAGGPGQETGETCPTLEAPISIVFDSIWLIFGRAIISRGEPKA